jgi:1-pyrroline-5-carboxylate dehydrogenase
MNALLIKTTKLKHVLSQYSQNRLFSIIKYLKYQNEPILDYKKDSIERIQLQEKLQEFLNIKNDKNDALFDIPIIIGDKEIRNNNIKYQLIPFNHKLKLARFYHADKKTIEDGIRNCLEARASWEATSIEYRTQILLKAADTLAKQKRADILAATILGQGKTVYQAEIDAACELIDFFRFNVQFLHDLLKYKPLDVANHTVNNMELRGLEGFVAAISPFNFTAIGGNLAAAPALMGNVVVWKPSDTALLSSYFVYKVNINKLY